MYKSALDEWIKLEQEMLQMASIFTRLFPSFKLLGDSNEMFRLRILTGKKHPKIKLLRLRKIRIWTFGSLVHHIRGSKTEINCPKK